MIPNIPANETVMYKTPLNKAVIKSGKPQDSGK